MTQKILVIIDMQNDFITGALGTQEAQAIVKKVKRKIDLAVKEKKPLSIQEIPTVQII